MNLFSRPSFRTSASGKASGSCRHFMGLSCQSLQVALPAAGDPPTTSHTSVIFPSELSRHPLFPRVLTVEWGSWWFSPWTSNLFYDSWTFLSGDMLPIIHLCAVFFHCFLLCCKLFFLTYLMLIASINSLKDTITFVFFQSPSNFSVLQDLTKII